MQGRVRGFARDGLTQRFLVRAGGWLLAQRGGSSSQAFGGTNHGIGAVASARVRIGDARDYEIRFIVKLRLGR